MNILTKYKLTVKEKKNHGTVPLKGIEVGLRHPNMKYGVYEYFDSSK